MKPRPQPPAPPAPPTRRGGAYVLVLIVSAVAATIAVGGLALRQSAAERGSSVSDLASARLLAQSGLEAAMQWGDENPGWRAAGDLARTIDYTIGTDNISVVITDPSDDDLTDDDTDPYMLTSTATVGDTRAVLSVRISLPSATTFRDRALAASPLAFWPLDDNSGLVIKRLAGDRNGAYSSFGVPGRITGEDGRPAPWFDSLFKFGFVLHYDELLLDTGTIMCGVYIEAGHDTDRTVIAKDKEDDNAGDFHLYVAGNKNDLYIYLANDSKEETIKFMSLEPGAWYNVAVTFGPDGLYGFVNGVKKAQKQNFTTGIGPAAGDGGNTHPFQFGAWWDGDKTYNPMYGSVRDVVILDRQLSAEQITALLTDDQGEFGTNPGSWAWVVD